MSEMSSNHPMEFLLSKPPPAAYRRQKPRPQVDKELPTEFVDRFIAVFQKYDPVVADKMIESQTAPDEALTFYKALQGQMSASDLAGLTADIFENLVANGLAMVEIKKAGIDVLSLETQHDVLRALRSRQFKRYLKAEARTARANLKELRKRQRTREARMKELAAKKQGINDVSARVRETLSDLNESIAKKELVIEEIKEEKAYLTQNWPPPELVDKLKKAQDELARYSVNPG